MSAHREMVDEYYRARDIAIRTREVAAGDEDVSVPTFKEWLSTYWHRATIERHTAKES